MSHIGLFGGTFDPIHNGHLITVNYLYEKRNLDKLILMPSYISPLKMDVKSASSEDRFKMAKLAVQGFSNFEVSDFEIKNGGVSYTIDTLKELKKVYEEIDLIIGYDNLLIFDKWKNPEQIFELANVVVMKRSVDSPGSVMNEFCSKATIINTPIIDISSTEIRERVTGNLPIDKLVPQKVNDYIVKNKLYQPKIL